MNPMKKLLMACFTSMLLFSSQGVMATHTLNYYAWYTVLEDNSSSTKFEFHLDVFAECYYANPQALRSDMMLGIYNPNTGVKITEVQLQYLQDELLQDLMDQSSVACYMRVELVNQFTLPKDSLIDHYQFQVSSCCYANFFQNIMASQSPGIFQEWQVPLNLPQGFKSARLNSNTLFPMKSRTSAWLDFSESKEGFDSIRYEFSPAMHDPKSANYQVGYCSPTALVTQHAIYRPGYNYLHPFGTAVQHVLNDSGTLKVGRNFTPGFHQIALLVKYYLNGQSYSGIRYITTHIIPQLDPQTLLQAYSYSDSSLAIRTNLINFDDFKSAELFRAETKSGPFTFIRNLSTGENNFADYPLSTADTFYYFVQSINAIDSFYSDTVYGVRKPVLLDFNLRATDSTDHSIQVSWRKDDFPDFLKFILYRSELNHPTTRMQLYTGTDTSFLDINLNSGTAYFYTISTFNPGLWYAEDSLIAHTTGWKTGVSLNSKSKLTLYPIPAKNEVFFSEMLQEEISVFSSTGKLVYRGNPGKSLNLDAWPAGVYMLPYHGQVYRILKID